jgi:hypothetical protein
MINISFTSRKLNIITTRLIKFVATKPRALKQLIASQTKPQTLKQLIASTFLALPSGSSCKAEEGII